MPNLELSLPAQSDEVKTRLAEALTRTFSEITGHPAEIFGIRFLEYTDRQTAVGGKLMTAASPGQPYLHGLLYVPRLKRAKKQQLVERLTAVFAEAVGRPDWKIVFHLCEHPYDNVGVNGKLLSDQYRECAEARFYYELPKD